MIIIGIKYVNTNKNLLFKKFLIYLSSHFDINLKIMRLKNIFRRCIINLNFYDLLNFANFDFFLIIKLVFS